MLTINYEPLKIQLYNLQKLFFYVFNDELFNVIINPALTEAFTFIKIIFIIKHGITIILLSTYLQSL